MRLIKSLLCGISALALTAGAAFAETSDTPELLSEQYSEYSEMSPSELAMEEGDVIYIYPMEVTEYYLVIPESQSLG